MKKIVIGKKESGTYGEICPDYGGMLTRFVWEGREVIGCDEDMLALSTLLAGGCPVLFPFASKTKGDVYEIEGTQYSMPFHGLVKQSAFGVKEAGENSATLFITNNEASLKNHYPYAYRLEVTYSLEGNRLLFRTKIVNESDRRMPHYFGWHHYFQVSRKESAKLKLPMRKCLDYTDGRDGEPIPVPQALDLSRRMDWVLFDKTSNEIFFENEGDAYRMNMKLDDAFQAVVICTCFDGRVTIEPWIGIPDAIHRGNYVEWIERGEWREYGVEVSLSEYFNS